MFHRGKLVLLLISLIQWSVQDETSTQPALFESNETETSTTCSIGNETCSNLSSTGTLRDETATTAASSPLVNVSASALPNASVSTTPVPQLNVSTTAVPSTTMPSTAKPSVPIHGSTKKTDPEADLTEGKACTCDLMAEECEINCCCDPDCRPYQISVFSSCLPRPRPLFDDRMCHTLQTVVVNNTQKLVEINRPGAFCIVKTNIAAWVVYPTRPAILSQSKFSRIWSRTRSQGWPKVDSHSHLSGDQKHYTQDSYLWNFHPQHVDTFVLPSPSATSVCSSKRPVKFLRPWSKTCIQQTPLNRAECQKQSADFFISQMDIVRNPISVNRTQLALDKMISCPIKLCAPVFSFSCSKQAMAEGNFSSCRNITTSTQFSFNDKTSVCNGIVKDLRMVISHNGTEGIHSIMVYLSLRNTSTARPVLLQRSYSVVFQWSNYNISSTNSSQNGTNSTTQKDAARRSGHPGYIVGKAVRSGHRYQVEDPTKQTADSGKRGEDTAAEEKVRLSATYQDVLSLFGPGPCEGNKRHAVLFGEDVHVSCGLTLKKSNFSSPEKCTELRVEVIRHLLGRFYTKKLLKASSVDTWGIVIGTFGDSSPDRLSDWIPLILDGLSMTPAELSHTENRSSANDLRETLKCDGIFVSMEMRVLHALIGSNNNPQSKIIGASIRFEPAQDLEWHCDTQTEECLDPLYLTTSVKFVDVSSPAVAKYAEPPGIHISLPPDFFYPFMIAKNSIGRTAIDNTIVTFCLIILACGYYDTNILK